MWDFFWPAAGGRVFGLGAAGHRPQNFYMLGSMGLACPIALGDPLAQPKRGVIALEGDGSILMMLGSLATIANARPANLTIIIRGGFVVSRNDDGDAAGRWRHC